MKLLVWRRNMGSTSAGSTYEWTGSLRFFYALVLVMLVISIQSVEQWSEIRHPLYMHNLPNIEPMLLGIEFRL